MYAKTIAISQSNYIPWKGFFDLIHSVDEFILFDDMQFTRRDWRNRNTIKTPSGLHWLTVPVENKGKYFQRINEVQVVDGSWAKTHWAALVHNYSRSAYFSLFRSRFESLFRQAAELKSLSQINRLFLDEVCSILGISTRISWSMDYRKVDGKTERLVDLCKQAGASRYLSGPSARDYIQPELFAQAGIELAFMDYSGYLEYPQLFGKFEHAVSVVDLLFNTGPNATKFMKSFQSNDPSLLKAS